MARWQSKFLAVFIICLALFPLLSFKAVAGSIDCPNRYVTLVNPVRARALWSDKSLKPLLDQYEAESKYNYPATWLLQYDAILDKELVSTVKSFQIEGERGVFLEVSEKLAEESGAAYLFGKRWSDPGVIFLSAYSPSQRRTIIDTLFDKFKKEFGNYPKSVGAWWIDSYSLEYLKNKYSIKSTMIVADQKVTDSYGVWGGWWGYPYYPTKANILVPGKTGPLDVVVTQWAQRDPVLAYGEGAKFSNFSLQANDYIASGKNTGYFKSLINTYLDCTNEIGQITVGMETGIESVPQQKEYENQLRAISEVGDVHAVTMSEFADCFRRIYLKNPSQIRIGGWLLTPGYRENLELGDRIDYKEGLAFKDYFLADSNGFLDRRLPQETPKNSGNYFPAYLILIVSLWLYSHWLKKPYFFLTYFSILFLGFGLLLRSKTLFGWNVFYGPPVNDIVLSQILVTGITFLVLLTLYKLAENRQKLLLFYLIPLVYGLDKLISLIRYTQIGTTHLFGILLDNQTLVGISWSTTIGFVKQTFSVTSASWFVHFPTSAVNGSPLYYFFLSPLVHLLLALALYWVLPKLPKGLKVALIIFLTILAIGQVMGIVTSDPISVRSFS
jgi:hypothetical protein